MTTITTTKKDAFPWGHFVLATILASVLGALLSQMLWPRAEESRRKADEARFAWRERPISLATPIVDALGDSARTQTSLELLGEDDTL